MESESSSAVYIPPPSALHTPYPWPLFGSPAHYGIRAYVQSSAVDSTGRKPKSTRKVVRCKGESDPEDFASLVLASTEGHSFASLLATAHVSPDSLDSSQIAASTAHGGNSSQGLDVRSMKYYQKLPVKLEDLLSDESSNECESEHSFGDTSDENAIIVRNEESSCNPHFDWKADEFFRKWLLRKGMKGLICNVLLQRELLKSAVVYHKKRKQAEIFRKWKKSTETLRKERLQNAMLLWRARAATARRLRATTAGKQKLLMSASFRLWQRRLLETRGIKNASQHFQMKMKQKMLVAWKTEAQTARGRWRELNSKAEAFRQNRTVERGFLVWRAWMLHCVDCKQRACVLLQRVLLRAALHRWRYTTNSRQRHRFLEEGFRKARERKTLQNALTTLREELRVRQRSKAAKYLHTLKSKRKALQAWRLYIYYCTLTKLCEACLEQRKTTLLQASFDQWVCQTASLAGEGLLSSRLSAVHRSAVLQKAFTSWQREARVSSGARVIRAMQGSRLVTQHFQEWKSSWLHIKSLEVIGNDLTKWRTKKQFRKWRAHLHHRLLERVAVKHSDFQCTRNAFTFWKAEYKRSKALHNLATSQESTMLRVSFLQWNAATRLRKEAKEMQVAAQLHNRMLLGRCLSLWRSHAHQQKAELSQCVEACESKSNCLKLASSLKAWRRQLECHNIVRKHLAEERYVLIHKCFLSWRELARSSSEEASTLFLSKLQLALSTDPHFSDAATAGYLAAAASNLGMGNETFEALSNLPVSSSLVQQQALQPQPSHSCSPDQLCLGHPKPLIQSTPHLLVGPVVSTLHSLPQRSEAGDDSSSIAVLHTGLALPGNTNNNNANSQDGVNSTPVRRQLFRADEEESSFNKATTSEEEQPVSPVLEFSAQKSSHELSAEQLQAGHPEETSVSQVDTLSPLHMCRCLDPDTAHQIAEVQQKLTNLSSSFEAISNIEQLSQNTSDISGEHSIAYHLGGNSKDILPTSEDSPILSPPPGFSESDCVESQQTHTEPTQALEKASQTMGPTWSPIVTMATQSLQLLTQLSPSLVLDRSTVTDGSVTMPRPLYQLQHTLRYMKLYPCSKVFYTWRRYSERRRRLKERSELAQEKLQKQAAVSVFQKWRGQARRLSALRDLEKQHCADTDIKIARRCFTNWKEELQRALKRQEMEKTAMSCYASVCLRKHLLQWRTSYCALVEAENSQCHKMEIAIILRSVFKQWRKQASQRQLSRRVVQRWKQTARTITQEKQAERLDTYWTLSRAWTQWKVAYVRENTAAATIQRIEKDLLKQVFLQWRSVVTT